MADGEGKTREVGGTFLVICVWYSLFGMLLCVVLSDMVIDLNRHKDVSSWGDEMHGEPHPRKRVQIAEGHVLWHEIVPDNF